MMKAEGELTTVTEPLNDEEFVLIGTAHVSEAGADTVERVVRKRCPDTVAIEVGIPRYQFLLQQLHKNEDRETGGLLSSLQARLEQKFGVKPGVEARRAIEVAQQLECAIAPIDQSFNQTRDKLYKAIGPSEILRIGFGLFRAFVLNSPELPNLDEFSDHIEQQGGFEEVLEKMKEIMPGIHEVLVEQRNRYMAQRLRRLLDQDQALVAVVGAAHQQGIDELLRSERKIKKQP